MEERGRVDDVDITGELFDQIGVIVEDVAYYKFGL